MKLTKTTIFAFIFAAATFGFLVGASLQSPSVHAQNPTLTPYQYGVNNVPHTSCVVVASSTQYCNASDGPFVSINGAAFVAMLPVAGTTLTGADPINISSSGVVSLNSDVALKSIIDGVGLTASIPASSVSIPAGSGTLPASSVPVK